ncbi:hypothetical protein MC885_019022 [Smutsia gigantea]|nr:hypothetical protein MC885_019022 [Smutsia gigantea]
MPNTAVMGTQGSLSGVHSAGTFAGNTNADGMVHHKLLHSERARFVRFVPLEWNPSGKIGMRVEVYGCPYKSDVADFDGRSSLLYRFSQKLMSTFKDVISLKFKSMQGDGVLLHGEGQRGDHINLELQKGRLALHLSLDDSKARLGHSPPSAALGSVLDDQHWHSVLIERAGKQVNFTVDKHTLHLRTKGEADALDIDYELSFGGIPVPGKPGTFLKKNFHGCIENLYYNGVNIIDLAKRRKHQIYTVGNVTFSCSEPQIVPITFVSSSRSYLLLTGTPHIDGLSVSFQFRTWNKDGLLLSTVLSEASGTLLLSLQGGTLALVIWKATERAAEILKGNSLNDGLWHSVSITARRGRITLTLDNDATSPAQDTTRVQIYSGNSYYFGGCPDNLTDSQCLNPIKAFQGCMRLIFIDNQPKDLISVQQGSLGNFSDLHIDLCSIKDRVKKKGGRNSFLHKLFHSLLQRVALLIQAGEHQAIYKFNNKVLAVPSVHGGSRGGWPLLSLPLTHCFFGPEEMRTWQREAAISYAPYTSNKSSVSLFTAAGSSYI